ncbi:hypothetical protein D9619_003090 [Psilocybe cf. subviscida]|uniref:SprT-like domain-containing protein n=1 Tax=Psilocybe cf. subviscida TaxID=2480587 RepID=A0A8H5EUB2_9AGAR|nr:hypothetical protein D9619_003090 [Psilocybe cf. subviscida]
MPTIVSDRNTSSGKLQMPTPTPGKKAQYPITYEIESDSDDCPIQRRQRNGPPKVIDIIEISSDSDEEPVQPRPNRKQSSPTPPPETPAKKRIYSRRRIVESSDEASAAGSENEEIIELSDSPIGREPLPLQRKSPASPPSRLETNLAQTASGSSTSGYTPVDESTILFNEPKTARRPMRLDPPSQSSIDRTTGNLDEKTASKMSNQSESPVDPVAAKPANAPAVQRTPKPKTAAKTPRLNTKKAREEAEILRRQEYAQKLFDDLNKSVFKDGLPASTKLVWNKRLLTTAGKAKYHREGVTTTQIELAEKILDCDERIRNTLSHEMCHLATWVIDEKINEHHGSFFKRWAYLVEKKHPHIEVSVKHNYEISYPYEWKCEKCAKIYGRFSKSIKPEECLCGACREGKLIPQFSVRSKAATPKLSRMAAARPQDSPRIAQGNPAIPRASDSDSEEDIIQALTQTLATTVLEA